MMKVNIETYEVNFNAKFSWMVRANKHDSLLFLNWLSIVLDSASENEFNLGRNSLGKSYDRIANELYEYCKKNGLYEQ